MYVYVCYVGEVSVIILPAILPLKLEASVIEN